MGRGSLETQGTLIAKQARVAAPDGRAALGFGVLFLWRGGLQSDVILRDGASAIYGSDAIGGVVGGERGVAQGVLQALDDRVGQVLAPGLAQHPGDQLAPRRSIP